MMDMIALGVIIAGLGDLSGVCPDKSGKIMNEPEENH